MDLGKAIAGHDHCPWLLIQGSRAELTEEVRTVSDSRSSPAAMQLSWRMAAKVIPHPQKVKTAKGTIADV